MSHFIPHKEKMAEKGAVLIACVIALKLKSQLYRSTAGNWDFPILLVTKDTAKIENPISSWKKRIKNVFVIVFFFGVVVVVVVVFGWHFYSPFT